jgi:ATP/maltotriose-dependent transcriptional regulator MalT
MAAAEGRDDAYSIGGLRVPAEYAAGYEALRTANWDAARTYFEASLREGERAEVLECLGAAACQVGDVDATFQARERAFELFRARGDAAGAARVALRLAVDCATFRGHVALANGWLRRAHTLLNEVEPCAEHGWAVMIEAEKALIVDNDCAASEDHALRAAAFARRFGDSDLEAEALAIVGLSQVTAGRVQEGLGRLDEAGTACLSGDVNAPWVVSSVLCNMMDACDRARDWDRAREWFAHIEKLAREWGDPVLHAQCRPHYAVVLTWRGAWDEAERELQHAIDELSVSFKPMAVEGIVRLAELRWRQGRLEDAATLFDQVNSEPLAQLGQAVLAIERDDAAAALDFVERCIRHLPPQDRLERLPALELHIRACLLLGDCDRAREVMPELEEMMRAVPTRPLRASAQLALGLIAAAEDRPEDARMHLEDAVDLFDACGAPFEAGRARLDLARVLIELGRADDAVETGAVAEAAFGRLGAAREETRARDLIRRASGTARVSLVPQAHGLTAREVEVLRLLASGLSNQEIADRLVLSIRTVQRHVENIYAKTGARGRAAAAVFAATHALIASA